VSERVIIAAKRVHVKNSIFGFIAVVLVAAAAFSSYHFSQQTFAAAPTVITVTTTTDEDADPGVGCSLYEASIAANTGAAYGGCPAGDPAGNNLIELGTGTYTQDLVTYSGHRDIMLDNASLVGAGKTSTILRGYALEMTGAETTSVEDLTVTQIVGMGNPTATVLVNGPNKTLDSLVITSNFAPAEIKLAEDSSVVFNVTINNVDLNSNVATAKIDCQTGLATPCDDVTISNTTLTAPSQVGIFMSDSTHVTVSDVTTTVNSSQGVEVGANSTVTNLRQVGNGSGYSYMQLLVGAGTVIDGLEQEGVDVTSDVDGEATSIANVWANVKQANIGIQSLDMKHIATQTTNGAYITNDASGGIVNDINMTDTNGSDVYLDVEAATVSDIIVDTDGDGALYFYDTYVPGVSFTNVTINGGITSNANISLLDGLTMTSTNTQVDIQSAYVGSTIKNVDIHKTGTLTNPIFYLKASVIDNFVVNAEDTMVNLINSNDGAHLTNVHINTPNANGGAVIFEVNGDDVVIEDLSIITDSPTTSVQFQGKNLSVNNVKLENARLYIVALTDSIIDINHVSIINPPTFGIFLVGGPYASTTIKNSYISHTEQTGIMAVATGENLLVENVFVDDAGFNSPGAGLFSTDVNHVTVKNSTFNRVIGQSFYGAVAVAGGVSHSVSNVTIRDSNTGLALLNNANSNVSMLANNVTIVNDIDPVGYDSNTTNRGVYAGGSAGLATDLTVNNSIIGGQSPYIECEVTDDGTITFNNSVSSAASCAPFGATQTNDIAALLDTTLAENSTTQPAIGYNALDGKVPTLALVAGSGAAGAGGAGTCESTDTRGVTRVGAPCDQGAFQLSAPIAPVTPGSGGPVVGTPNTGLKGFLVNNFVIIILAGICITAVAAISLRRLQK